MVLPLQEKCLVAFPTLLVSLGLPLPLRRLLDGVLLLLTKMVWCD